MSATTHFLWRKEKNITTFWLKKSTLPGAMIDFNEYLQDMFWHKKKQKFSSAYSLFLDL